MSRVWDYNDFVSDVAIPLSEDKYCKNHRKCIPMRDGMGIHTGLT